ncbi:MAG: DUF6383 domain-containing protein [Bacteroidales bacterium]
MNKNFLTFIAGALMPVAFAGTLNAQSVLSIEAGTPAEKLPDNGAGLYQLAARFAGSAGDSLLLRVDKDGILYVDSISAYPDVFGSSLWCVQASNVGGGDATFTFTNKMYGYPLAVAEEDAVGTADSIDVRFGTHNEWYFSKTYSTALDSVKVLYAYYNADSVLVLTAPSAGSSGYYVKAKKYVATALNLAPGDPGSPYQEKSVLRFTVTKPAVHVLNAEDFNTFLTGEPKARKLTFSQNKENTQWMNPWSDYELTAEDDTVSGWGRTPDSLGWVRFKRSDTEYLRVDTAYTGEESKFLTFTFAPLSSSLKNQYLFRLTYDVAMDSLGIDVAQAIFPQKDDCFSATRPTIWLNGHGRDSLHVKWQELSDADNISIITVGEEPAKTHVQLGISGCTAVESDLTSLEKSGLYTIKNDEGQYLGVPIYTDSTKATGAEWMDLHFANPNNMPAFQWVVVKAKEDFDISPIKIVNREFPKIMVSKLQLLKNKESDDNNKLFNANVRAEYFIPAPDAQKDSLTGYKYTEKADFFTYLFNYLHTFDASRYLTVNKNMIVIGTTDGIRTQFQLVRGADEYYGYGTEVPFEIDGIAPLKRVTYTIRVKDLANKENDGKYISLDESSRHYIISATHPAVFYLKTDNTREAVDYYALVDSLHNGKLGIDEVGDDLWAFAQGQREHITSTFAVTGYTNPPYRRFDGGIYGLSEIKEEFGDAFNAPQWLKFTKINNRGFEYLAENSGKLNDNGQPNNYRDDLSAAGKNISFLGLYNRKQYEEKESLLGYTFFVDTAYVRGNTLKPQYMLAIDAHFSPENAFVMGRYLFNPTDSIANGNDDYAGKAAYNAQGRTRLAFVKGVHLADTFFVLRGSNGLKTFEEIRKDVNFLYSIGEEDKIYLGNNESYVPRWTGKDAVDTGKNGKSMVFQFRLVAPDDRERRFLIETQAEAGDEGNVAPVRGRWLKMQNGVPIICEMSGIGDAVTGGAEIFTVEAGVANEAVANEAAVTSGVQVISEVGGVTIRNAAGKKVAISNVLGQIVVKTAIASDHATINNLPKGIVVVAVEGEPAVKAMVK